MVPVEMLIYILFLSIIHISISILNILTLGFQLWIERRQLRNRNLCKIQCRLSLCNPTRKVCKIFELWISQLNIQGVEKLWNLSLGKTRYCAQFCKIKQNTFSQYIRIWFQTSPFKRWQEWKSNYSYRK